MDCCVFKATNLVNNYGQRKSVWTFISKREASNKLYTVLPAGFSSANLLALAKTYSFAIFGGALAGVNCKCVWLYVLANIPVLSYKTIMSFSLFVLIKKSIFPKFSLHLSISVLMSETPTP